MNLLIRFYDPTFGRIALDGLDLQEYRLADLRRQFGIVLQEPILFSTTVAENIAYARPDATSQAIEDAARAANAHDFIVNLPDGYDTEVGERGMRLSGGERQRISLARAFLRDAPILILDEPTSSVDVATEASILEAMDRLMAGRTSFMIAHRLSTLDICDMRLELTEGRLDGRARAPQRRLSLSGDLMRRPAIRENARFHAAARAWRRLGGERDPVEIRVLRDRPEHQVYWLAGAGPGGATIIAKHEQRSRIELEHRIYTKVLPRLPVPSLQYHGLVDGGGSFGWTFFEFASGKEYSKTDDDHRRLAGEWLGLLHAAAAEVPGIEQLGDRGPDYFLDRLMVARSAVDRQLKRATRADAVLLQDVIRTLEALQTRWEEVRELCGTCRYTLVHGDFGRKNIRVQSGPLRARLQVFDWAEAGWGPPLIDLTPANPCLHAYRRGFCTGDVAPPIETLKRFAALAKILRMVRVIEWETHRFGPGYVRKEALTAYLEQLHELMREARWSHRPAGLANGRL
jgi:ABC-type lipoprotein export system ATPase subunit